MWHRIKQLFIQPLHSLGFALLLWKRNSRKNTDLEIEIQYIFTTTLLNVAFLKKAEINCIIILIIKICVIWNGRILWLMGCLCLIQWPAEGYSQDAGDEYILSQPHICHSTTGVKTFSWILPGHNAFQRQVHAKWERFIFAAIQYVIITWYKALKPTIHGALFCWFDNDRWRDFKDVMHFRSCFINK